MSGPPVSGTSSVGGSATPHLVSAECEQDSSGTRPPVQLEQGVQSRSSSDVHCSSSKVPAGHSAPPSEAPHSMQL